MSWSAPCIAESSVFGLEKLKRTRLTEPLMVFPVRVEGNSVYVDVSAGKVGDLIRNADIPSMTAASDTKSGINAIRLDLIKYSRTMS